MRIKHSHVLAANAGASGFYVGFIAPLAADDPGRVSYDEFKQQVFDCEFGEQSGASTDEAVTIGNAANGVVGVCAEYLHLAHVFGRQGRDWELDMQMAVRGDGGRTFDLMVVKLADGSEREVYYETTAFQGRRPGAG